MKTSKYSICLTSLGVLLILGSLNFRASMTSGRIEAPEGLNSHTNAQTVGAGSATSLVGPIRNLRFVLHDAGIRPSEMRIKAGLVNILIEDKTNVSQGVRLQRVLGSERTLFGEVQKAAATLRGRSRLRLPAGQYELQDISKPGNKAVIVVEP